MATASVFKVAAAHAAPVFMDKAATIKKVISLIEQSANDSIKLLVFPETFIPGYPVRRLPSTPQLQRQLTCVIVLDRMLPTSETSGGSC